MATAVIVTAAVSKAVFTRSSSRRSAGMSKAEPLPTTWKSRLTGGTRVGRRAIPAATHHPL
jgi:hypothetical protein